MVWFYFGPSGGIIIMHIVLCENVLDELQTHIWNILSFKFDNCVL